MRLSIKIIFLLYVMLASRAVRFKKKRPGRVMKLGEEKDQDGPKRRRPAIGMGSSASRRASAKHERDRQLAEDENHLELEHMLRIEKEMEKDKREARHEATGDDAVHERDRKAHNFMYGQPRKGPPINKNCWKLPGKPLVINAFYNHMRNGIVEVTDFKKGSGHRSCTVKTTNGGAMSVSRGDLKGAAAPVIRSEEIARIVEFMASIGALRVMYDGHPALLTWSSECTSFLQIVTSLCRWLQ